MDSVRINKELLRFISENSGESASRLLLKYHGLDLPFDLDFAAMQIECRKKYASKFKGFLDGKEFLFPMTISCEQATDAAVARYHSSLVGGGCLVLDMTAGLGIDAISIARGGSSVTACEMEPVRVEILAYNASLWTDADITVYNGDSVDFLRRSDKVYDVIFVDPARRSSAGDRVYGFADCTPDILANMDLILSRCRRLLVKASPMLDISEVLRSVGFIRSIDVVCRNGECKEVLLDIIPGYEGEVTLRSVDIRGDYEVETFEFSAGLLGEKAPCIASADEIEEGMYLYRPNAAMMKFGAWGVLCARFPGLLKASANCNVFFSSWLYRSFPGQVSVIKSFPDKKEMKSLKGTKINVVSRNYPVSAPDMKKKYGLKDGGSDFLYGITVGRKEQPLLVMTSLVEAD